MPRLLARIVGRACLRRTLLTALAAALVLAQAGGLQHRIEHTAAGGWTGGIERCAPSAGASDSVSCDHGADHVGGTAKHHCVAVDALALGDGPPHAPLSMPASPPVTARVADNPRACPRTDGFLAFAARAPPAVLS